MLLAALCLALRRRLEMAGNLFETEKAVKCQVNVSKWIVIGHRHSESSPQKPACPRLIARHQTKRKNESREAMIPILSGCAPVASLSAEPPLAKPRSYESGPPPTNCLILSEPERSSKFRAKFCSNFKPRRLAARGQRPPSGRGAGERALHSARTAARW